MWEEGVVVGDSEGVGQEGEGDSKPATYVNTAVDVIMKGTKVLTLGAGR